MYLTGIQSFGSFGVGKAATATLSRLPPSSEYNKNYLKHTGGVTAVVGKPTRTPIYSTPSDIEYAATPTLKRLKDVYNTTYLQRTGGVSAPIPVPYSKERAMANFIKSGESEKKDDAAPQPTRMELLKQLIKSTGEGLLRDKLLNSYNFILRMDIISKKRPLTAVEQRRLEQIISEIDKELENFNPDDNPLLGQMQQDEEDAWDAAGPSRESANISQEYAQRAQDAAQRAQDALKAFEPLPVDEEKLQLEQLEQDIEEEADTAIYNLKQELGKQELSANVIDKIRRDARNKLTQEFEARQVKAPIQPIQPMQPIQMDQEQQEIKDAQNAEVQELREAYGNNFSKEDLNRALERGRDRALANREYERQREGKYDQQQYEQQRQIELYKRQENPLANIQAIDPYGDDVRPIKEIMREQEQPAQEQPAQAQEPRAQEQQEEPEPQEPQEPVSQEEEEEEGKEEGKRKYEIPEEEMKKNKDTVRYAFNSMDDAAKIKYLLARSPENSYTYINKINDILQKHKLGRATLDMETMLKISGEKIAYLKIKEDKRAIARALLNGIYNLREDGIPILNDIIFSLPPSNTPEQEVSTEQDIQRMKQRVREEKIRKKAFQKFYGLKKITEQKYDEIMKADDKPPVLTKEDWIKKVTETNISKSFQLNKGDMEEILKLLNKINPEVSISPMVLNKKKGESLEDVYSRLWDTYPIIREYASRGDLTREHFGIMFAPIKGRKMTKATAPQAKKAARA